MKKSTLIDVKTRETARETSQKTLAEYNEIKAHRIAKQIAHSSHETKNSYRAKARRQRLNVSKTLAYLEGTDNIEETEEPQERDLLDRYYDEQLQYFMSKYNISTMAELDDVMMHDNVR